MRLIVDLGPVVCARVIAIPAAAQEQRGAIEGTVQDAQHAVIPGATVAALNLGQGTTVSTVPDASGTFRFPALAPGLLRRHGVSAWFHHVQVRARRGAPRAGSSGCRSYSRLRPSPRRSTSRPPRRWWTHARARACSACGRTPSTCCPRAAISRRWSARRPAPTRSRSSGASRSTARARRRIASSSTASRPRTCFRACPASGPAGVRRRDPGEVERLRRRVRRLDRRRDQRRDEERHQRVARRSAGQPRRRRARGRAAADPAPGAHGFFTRRVRDLPGRHLYARRARRGHGRPDQARPRLAVRRLSARPDSYRTHRDVYLRRVHRDQGRRIKPIISSTSTRRRSRSTACARA